MYNARSDQRGPAKKIGRFLRIEIFTKISFEAGSGQQIGAQEARFLRGRRILKFKLRSGCPERGFEPELRVFQDPTSFFKYGF